MRRINPSQKTTKLSSVKYEDIHFVDSTKSVWNYSLFTEEDVIQLKFISFSFGQNMDVQD